jgi:hypothetical protein
MIPMETTDRQILSEAKAALLEKDTGRAAAIFAAFSERSEARAKARVANDPA